MGSTKSFPLPSGIWIVDRKVRVQQTFNVLLRNPTMASLSISCTTHQPITSKPSKSPLSSTKLSSEFLGIRTKVGFARLTSKIGPSNGCRTRCWFKFGKNGVDAEGAGIYGSQSRDDFNRDDVEQVGWFLGFFHLCMPAICGLLSKRM